MVFKKEHIDFLRMLGITDDLSAIAEDDVYTEIEEKVSVFLQQYGFDERYALTRNGILCEEILEILQE